ncbi:hypothetical protein EG329_010275 [Mollisiaceae sp. DMI_Dod_QoI]|nr:hypothetical protein EG329_010275 [Helotiales sp. DMI_Dod_QoI]
MEPYSSFNQAEEQDDEPYYCTPAINPDDIICAGSDTEETPEEILQKRLRYEAQARRYMRGHRPVILSASLRGPCSKESGWVNPWSRPTRRKHGSQTKSGEVMHTRANSLRKYSAPDLGYENPAEVLAWQARVGAVESIIDEEEHIDFHQMREDAYGEEPGFVSTQGDQSTKLSRVARSAARPEDSLINFYTKTPQVGADANVNGNGTKRAIDLEWLKGSYVSKRARWDGPAVSSPTPTPHYIGARGRERKYASTKLAEQEFLMVDHHTSSAARNSDQATETLQQTPIVQEDNQVDTLFSAQIQSQRIFNLDTVGTGVSSIRMTDVSQQPLEDQEIDELQEDSQGSRPESRKSSGRKPRKSPNTAIDHSFSDLEQDELVVITPRPDTFDTPMTSGGNLQMRVNSGSLPRLLHPESALEFEEHSFISEVAPSSRNLEKFYFKKKRRRTKSSEHEKSGRDDGQNKVLTVALAKANPKSTSSNSTIHAQIRSPGLDPGTDVQDVTDDEAAGAVEDATHVENAEADGAEVEDVRDVEDAEVEDVTDDREELHTVAVEFLVQDENSTMPSSEPQGLRVSLEEPPSNSGEADVKWDLNEMSFLRAVLRAGNPDSQPPTNEPVRMRKSSETPIPVDEDEGNSQHSENLSDSNNIASQQHADGCLQLRPPQISFHSQGSKLSQDPNDVSTQSYNTTPVKSLSSVRIPQSTNPRRLSSPEVLGGPPTSKESGPNAEQNEMDKIQMELSQICPSSSPGSSVPYDDDDDFEEMDRPTDGDRDILTPTKTRIRDDCESPVSLSGHSQGSPDREHEVENALPGAEICDVKPDQLGIFLPDRLTKEAVGEIETHIEPNETAAINSESDNAAEASSEASWQGCGPQSPWAIEHIEPIPMKENQGEPSSLARSDIERPLVASTAFEQIHNPDTSSGWQHIDHPQITENSGIKSFKELMTPTESPGRTEVDRPETLTNTQLLVDAATNNPWAIVSSLKKPSSTKKGKRVSFGKLFSQDTEDSQSVQTNLSKKGPTSPPPPTAMHFQDEDVFNNGARNVYNKFEKQFTSARRFKRILPENVASPVNSSPALGAQAEAFIAADRGISREKDPTATQQTPTKHLRPRSEANSNIAWNQPDETEALTSYSKFEESHHVSTSLASFDMEDALGEVGNFLEDWSVDSELKKAKESDGNRDEESNGYRRRKLFGLV